MRPDGGTVEEIVQAVRAMHRRCQDVGVAAAVTRRCRCPWL
jgi:hypothetical protein